MTTENNQDQQDPVKRILDKRFGGDTFRDDEGDKDEPVKQRPAPIDPEAASEWRKEVIKKHLPPTGSPLSNDANGEEEDLGPNPGDTLAGAIVEERYGSARHAEIDLVKEFRKAADTFRLTCIEMGRAFPSRELSSAVTSFQVARQFLGKLAQQYGSSYPYPTKDGAIADAGEVDTVVIHIFHDGKWDTFSSAVKLMRDKAESLITETNAFFENTAPAMNLFEHACQIQVISELLKGKFWLGEILGLGNKTRQ